MAESNDSSQHFRGTRALILAATAAALVTLAVVALLLNIFERQ